MARDDKGSEEKAPAPPPKSSKMVLVLVIVLVLVLAAGGATIFMLMSGGKNKSKKHSADEGDGEEAAAGKPAIVALEDKFTVNLQADDGSQHYLQVPKVELEVGSAEGAALIEERKGKVSDRISTILRSRTMKDMQAPGSDIKLKEDLKAVINESLQLKGSKAVKEVILPSSFIIQ